MTDLADLVELAGEQDVQVIRARVVGLVHLMLDELEWTITNGTPAAKQSLLRGTIPVLMKALEDRDDVDDGLDDMRVEVKELNDAVRKGLLSIPVRAVEA